MTINKSLADSVREEIERKYRDALQAFETIKEYLADQRALDSLGERPPPKTPPSGTTVERVLGAIASEYKTVEQLQLELGLEEGAVRGVLYSKYVKISKKKVGKKMAFRQKKHETAGVPATGKSGVSVASLVRDALGNNKDGLSAMQVFKSLNDDLSRIGGTDRAVYAALARMKKTGQLAHDQSTGIYRLVS